MIFALLRRGDGLISGRLWLSSVVRHLQLGLIAAGHSVSADGKFGFDTERELKMFQRAEHLAETGTADKSTWAALAGPLRRAIGPIQEEVRKLLRGFDGDLDWIHEREGHHGTAYWPGGNSGITLDPGVDLGQSDDWTEIEKLYGTLLTPEQCLAAKQCLNLKGRIAKAALAANPVLLAVRISRQDAARIMPNTAKVYWDQIVKRFSALSSRDTLPSIQTVFLSRAYNRGPNNSDMGRLNAPLKRGSWGELANKIGTMQQHHQLEGIRIRRREEANLIRAELEYLSS